LDQVYATNFFFQDLANRTGREGIISLIASMPHENGQVAQQNPLAGFPDMQRHWLQFGCDYLDNNVHDTGLLTVDVKPQPQSRSPAGPDPPWPKGESIPLTYHPAPDIA